ncbi:MAG TPA: hypothetical protein VF221_06685 [Chloroflexota bacterium]
MKTGMRYILPLLGAGAITLSVFSEALASHPAENGRLSRDAVKAYTVNGRLTVTDVLRVMKNQSVYGRQYAHGGLQVWKGLSVTSGGVTADSLNVKGALGAASGTFSGNLQAGTLQSGAMNGSTLALSGAATIGGAVTSAGKLTANGVDAGSGGLTTSGNITTAGLAATSVADSGALSANTITSNGPISGQTGAFGNLQVSGNVNFSGANVTGLSLGNLNLTGATLSTLNVGTTASTTSPFLLSGNGKSVALGVNGNGALTADNLAVNNGLSVGGVATVGGNLAVGGTGGVTSNVLTAQNASGTSTPGTLSLIGSTIALNGNVQSSGSLSVLGGRDLVFSTGNGTATHVTSNTDLDVTGQITINADGSNHDQSITRTFIEPYSSIPYVVVTATSDPNPAGNTPKVWVIVNASSGKYTSFTLHYMVPSGPATAGSITYNYHVIAG